MKNKERRGDLEHDRAVKIIKILVKNKVIKKSSDEKGYLATYLAAFEILDLFNSNREEE